MTIDRRTLLQTAATIVAAASLPPVLAQNKRVLTLVDPSLGLSDLRIAYAKAIQQDLVRQWRDGLGSEIAASGGAVAYVRWDKALLLAGLARESGLRSGHRRLDRSVFEVRIGQT